MGKWIKNNLVLVAGITLPVLLVAGFFILSKAPGIIVASPEYDFLLVAYRYDYQHPRDFHLSFVVRDGTLYGKVIPVEEGQTQMSRQYAGIFRYRAADNQFEEIAYDLPEGLVDLKETLEFTVGETRHLQLDKRAESADGFSFEYLGYRGRGGLLGEIFGMGKRGSELVLNKDGAYFNLPAIASNRNYYQHDTQFMGWVMGNRDSP